jgi:hypothetical protein
MQIRRTVIGLLIAITFDCFAHEQIALAQTAIPSSPFQSRLTMQNAGENATFGVHRDPLNRPCLQIEAASRRHVINPNVYDHVVSVYNRCLKTIKLRVCYYKSDHCIDMELQPQKRVDSVLGIFPNMQYFRYSYREKF